MVPDILVWCQFIWCEDGGSRHYWPIINRLIISFWNYDYAFLSNSAINPCVSSNPSRQGLITLTFIQGIRRLSFFYLLSTNTMKIPKPTMLVHLFFFTFWPFNSVGMILSPVRSYLRSKYSKTGYQWFFFLFSKGLATSPVSFWLCIHRAVCTRCRIASDGSFLLDNFEIYIPYLLVCWNVSHVQWMIRRITLNSKGHYFIIELWK